MVLFPALAGPSIAICLLSSTTHDPAHANTHAEQGRVMITSLSNRARCNAGTRTHTVHLEQLI